MQGGAAAGGCGGEREDVWLVRGPAYLHPTQVPMPAGAGRRDGGAGHSLQDLHQGPLHHSNPGLSTGPRLHVLHPTGGLPIQMGPKLEHAFS